MSFQIPISYSMLLSDADKISIRNNILNLAKNVYNAVSVKEGKPPTFSSCIQTVFDFVFNDDLLGKPHFTPSSEVEVGIAEIRATCCEYIDVKCTIIGQATNIYEQGFHGFLNFEKAIETVSHYFIGTRLIEHETMMESMEDDFIESVLDNAISVEDHIKKSKKWMDIASIKSALEISDDDIEAILDVTNNKFSISEDKTKLKMNYKGFDNE